MLEGRKYALDTEKLRSRIRAKCPLPAARSVDRH